jgi:bacteriophage exclusion system BrxB-like protein
MQSVRDNFVELVQRVEAGRDFRHASFEPVYYLVFRPHEILDVKRLLPAWRAKLKNDGWDVTEFSIAQAILEICQTVPTRKIWLKADSSAPLSWKRANDAIANVISKGALCDRLGAVLDQLSSSAKALVLVTDLEALHPYTRIGAIESQLYGRFTVPTVILYPGERTGKTRLRFLGFYPEDGNYRSVHVGG